MDLIAISKIIRVENCFYSKAPNRSPFPQVVQDLVEQGFKEKFADDFLLSFNHEDQKNTNRNTVIYFDTTGCVIDTRYYIKSPEL